MEYEYSTVVKNLDLFVEYCKENKYELESESYQIRELYKNDSGIMARITTELYNERETTLLDFKSDDESDNVLKISKETIPLVVTKENKRAIDSILECFGYAQKKLLKRKRIIYVKNGVKFELDHYTEPNPFYVVAIEGVKEEVDVVYHELEDCYKMNAIPTP